MVSFLLDRGADMNIKNNDGYTALMSAASKNNESIVTLLVDRGADINIKNKVSFAFLSNIFLYLHKFIYELCECIRYYR